MLNFQNAKSRTVDYLRISITDRCNERCLYCMPEQLQFWNDRSEILTYEEILRIVRITTRMGFRKFRITGGEPTIRQGLVEFITQMAVIPGVESISMTTNGTRLTTLADPLKEAGLKSINISLDALNPITYEEITCGLLEPVLNGIQKAIHAGFEQIKLNTVLMRGINEKEIWPILHFSAEHHIPVRFIELMPITKTEMLSDEVFLPVGEILKMIREHDTLVPIECKMGNGPAKYYRLEKMGTIVGLIGAITNLHFCDHCNKIRLTADGKIRPCLGNHNEIDIKTALRNRTSDQEIASLIGTAIHEKPPEHLFRNNYQPGRVMTAIGG